MASIHLSVKTVRTIVKNKAKYALLGNMISAPFFQKIRTEQQLGYIVSGRNSALADGSYQIPNCSGIINEHLSLRYFQKWNYSALST